MIKTFEMFAGYGGASFALKKAGIDFECVGYSEIDKYAIQCYEQNHKGGTNFGDCTKINPHDIPDFDLLTGGFPCQSFSVAGKGLGELDTRGTLFNEIIRIAEVKKPKYMLLENVKGLTNKKHKATFDKILSELHRIGYSVKWKVLNTKEHGIPQNRERVFFVCTRLDIEDKFKFPEKEELKIFLKDVLEYEVDEKYYLKQEQIDRLLFRTNIKIPEIKEPCVFDVYNKKIKTDRVSITLTEPHHNNLRIIQINNPTHSNNRVYSPEGISPTLNTMGGGNRQPFIAASRGRNPANSSKTEQKLEPNFSGTSNCISTVQKDNYVVFTKNYVQYDLSGNNHKSQDQRAFYKEGIHGTLPSNGAGSKCKVLLDKEKLTIRKLTPTECFRLMGFLDDEIKLEDISNSQRYKLAGNGWDQNLVSKIFVCMFKNTNYIKDAGNR